MTAQATAAIDSTVVRQPKFDAMVAIAGRNRSWPVAAPPLRMPTTRPRRAVNQRAATVADSTVARKPVPAPTTKPHIRMSCHAYCIIEVEATPSSDQRQRIDHRAAYADALHDRRGERPDAAVEDEVDRDRKPDGGARPAELVLQRHHQDAGRGAHARAGQHHQAGDADDDPAVVDFVFKTHEGPASFLTQDLHRSKWLRRQAAMQLSSGSAPRRRPSAPCSPSASRASWRSSCTSAARSDTASCRWSATRSG